jgi:DNA-binding MarR family transcriptional regulator
MMNSDQELAGSQTGGQTSALEEVEDQVVGLFHMMTAVAEQLHGQGELTAARRGVLRSLARFGPQTIPQLARARPVSRQHIRALVQQLEADGLVELRDNIAHRRSRLVWLTPQGMAHLATLAEREEAFYATLELDVSEEALRSTAEVLHTLRETLAQAHLQLLRAHEDGAKAQP